MGSTDGMFEVQYEDGKQATPLTYRAGSDIWESWDGDIRLIRRLNPNVVGSAFELTDRRSMVISQFNSLGVILRSSSLDGKATTFVPTGVDGQGPVAINKVVDWQGRSATFNMGQTANGTKLVSIDYSTGDKVEFLYNEAGMLSTINLNGRTAHTLKYGDNRFDWALTGLVDAAGVQNEFYEYDSGGRAVATSLAGGISKYSLSWSKAPEITYKTYRITALEPGGQTDKVVQEFGMTLAEGVKLMTPENAEIGFELEAGLASGRNLLSKQSQPAGSGCSAAQSEFKRDASGRVLSSVDFVGSQTCFDRTGERGLERMRIEGLAAQDACSADLTNVNAPASGRKVHTRWHPNWAIKTAIAEPKRITTWVYNGQPDPLVNNEIVRCAPTDAVLPNGEPIVVLCRKYEEATNDQTGDKGFDAIGQGPRLWSYSYNARGQITNETNPRRYATSYTYWEENSFAGNDLNGAGEIRGHSLGDLKESQNQQSQITRYTHYNKRGQLLRTEAANGQIEEREYQDRGLLSKQSRKIGPAGTTGEVVDMTYYPTDLLKRVTRPDGSWQEYNYDDAHRLTSVLDHLGNSTQYRLNGSGQVIREAVKNSDGQYVKVVYRKYDALGRISFEMVSPSGLRPMYRSPFGGVRNWLIGRENACSVVDGDPRCTVTVDKYDASTGITTCLGACTTGWQSSQDAEGPSCSVYGAEYIYDPLLEECVTH